MPQAVKVGLFMTIALLVLGWLILSVEDWRLFGAKGQRVDARFDSVVGLDDKAAVRMAGVRVGRVDGIRLEGRRARVSLLLDQPVVLTEGTVAAIANQGLLGDKFVEIRPGPDGAPALAPGAVLEGTTPVSFDDAMAKIDKIGASVERFMGDLSGGGGAPGGLGDLIASIQATADELRAVIAENRTEFGGTVRNFERFSAALAEDLPRLTDQIERVLSQVDAVVAENRGNLKDSMANVKEVTERLQTSVDNLNQITDKIARGEGTLGKLVNSDEAHNELMSAMGSVEKGVDALTDTLGRVKKLRLDLALDTAYQSELEDWRTAFRLDLLPDGDDSNHLYRVELVTDPRGRIYDKTETVTVTLPDGSTATTVTERTVRDERRNTWSAMFGLPFADRKGAVWAGVIQNSGGFGIDYSLAEKKLWFSLEAFDFGREMELDPHLRFTTQWNFHKNLFIKGGYDDPLVDQYKSPFLGAGLRWSDDDLKYLMGSVPKL